MGHCWCDVPEATARKFLNPDFDRRKIGRQQLTCLSFDNELWGVRKGHEYEQLKCHPASGFGLRASGFGLAVPVIPLFGPALTGRQQR